MYRRFHDRFGTAGVLLGVIALILALGGSAIAAAGLTGKQKKEVTKIAKKYAGQDGAPGAAGLAGPAGTNGKDGVAGAPGAPGASVTGTPIAAGGDCGSATGVKYSLSGTDTNVCNGKKGADGQPGTPGEDGEDGQDGEDGACSVANPQCVLPPDATLKGTWSYGFEPGETWVLESISFGIPLSAAPQLRYVPEAGKEQFWNFEKNEIEEPENAGDFKCLGSADAPTAEPGYLCVYVKFDGPTPGNGKELTLSFSAFSANPGGAALFFTGGGNQEEGGFAFGTWAVTAP